jgi:hypothetical protein
MTVYTFKTDPRGCGQENCGGRHFVCELEITEAEFEELAANPALIPPAIEKCLRAYPAPPWAEIRFSMVKKCGCCSEMNPVKGGSGECVLGGSGYLDVLAN